MWMQQVRQRRRRGGMICHHFRCDVPGPADAVALMIGEQLLCADNPRFEIAQRLPHKCGQRRSAGERLRTCHAIDADSPTCLGTRRRGGFIAKIRRGSAVHSLLPFEGRWRVRPSLVVQTPAEAAVRLRSTRSPITVAGSFPERRPQNARRPQNLFRRLPGHGPYGFGVAARHPNNPLRDVTS